MRIQKLYKQGSSLVIAVPRKMLSDLGLYEGCRVLVSKSDDAITIQNFESDSVRQRWLRLEKAHTTGKVSQKTEHPVAREPGMADKIYEHWISHQNLIQHNCLNENTRATINRRLREGYTPEKIMMAITRYSELKSRGRAPGYNRWGLYEVVKRDGGNWIDRLADPSYPGIERQSGKNNEWDVGLRR